MLDRFIDWVRFYKLEISIVSLIAVFALSVITRETYYDRLSPVERCQVIPMGKLTYQQYQDCVKLFEDTQP